MTEEDPHIIVMSFRSARALRRYRLGKYLSQLKKENKNKEDKDNERNQT